MLVGDAMVKGLLNRGINIARVNYQENGNWAFLKDEAPYFHLHLYGRTTDSRHQKFGEALYFPDPSSSYYDNVVSLDTEDIFEIVKQMEYLENTDKYNLESWL